MDHLENFTEEELLLSESFHNWVKRSNPIDVQDWDNWLAKNPNKKDIVQNARNIILGLSSVEPEVPENDITAAWAQLQQTLQKRRLPATSNRKVISPRISISEWYAIAAMFIGLIVSGFFVLQLLSTNKHIEYVTHFGETKSLVLPDGSQIMLNGNSRISYKEKWTVQDNREVWLNGEAYFSVTKSLHQSKAKFIVHTDQLDVEVLGTQFNVTNRKKSTQVVLNEGQVKVRPKEDTAALIMKPGELLKFCTTQQKVIKKVVNPQMYSSWKSKIMVFEETSIEELAERLESTYGYKVEFADKALASRKLTGTIPSDNIDILLLTLSKLFNLDIHKGNHQILIKSNY